MSWSQLKDAYLKRGIVPVLGAGVSVGCGIPAWPDLLQRVLTHKLEAKLSVDDLRAHRLSLPAIARLIEERLPSRRAFVEAIRDALYQDLCFEDVRFYPGGVNKSNRRTFVRFIQKHNPTLRAMAALCAVPKPDGRTFDINPRIPAIVTFNLDALLQSYVYACYEIMLLRAVERPSALPRAGKINLYHMHGYLRFDQARGNLEKEAPDAVVLTEQNYFDFFNQPTSLFNYTFLYLLREYSCCFIGLSMEDENIRRLLHYAHAEQVEALRREGVAYSERTLKLKLKRHFAIFRRSGKSAIDRAISQTLLSLGVNVLWVKQFSEIPDHFGALYTAAGGDWSSVF